MPIEFNCSNCSSTLRVPDESAGAKARCPHCNGITSVPHGSAPPPPPPAPDDFGDLPSSPVSTPFTPPPRVQKPIPNNPYSSPTSAPGPKRRAAPKSGGRIVPTAAEPGAILSHAFKVWQENLGLLIGITVVAALINAPFNVIDRMILEPMSINEPEMALILSLAVSFVSWIVMTFIGIGMAQIAINLARGQNAEFSDLFNGGDVFLPTLGASLLAGIAMGLGCCMLVIPGIILAVLGWPYYYIIVDKRASVFDSFGLAFSVGKLNVGTTIVLFLASIGITIVGFIACIVGVFAAAPLVAVMFATAYLAMTGQLRLR